MSATPDSTLADPQQIIADLQRQLAECGAERDAALAERDKAHGRLAERTAERDEALEQQTATAEVLGVINSSPGDLAPVFDAILEKAHALCGVAHGALVLREGETFRAVATHSYSGRFAEQLRQGYRGADNPLTRALLDGERFVHISDLSQVDHPMIQASVDNAGVRTGLYVPLRKDDALLGMISSCRREVRPFSEKEIALVENFAAQAVIAIENARLLGETREALEQQTATAEVLQVINSSPGDLAPVFDAMLDKAMRLCEAAFGMMVGYDREQFPTIATRGLPPAAADFLQKPLATEGSLAELVRGENVIHIPDARETETYSLGVPGRRAFVDLAGARTALWVALRKEQALLGAFIIYRQEVRPFTDKQIALLQNFAAQAVIAMENARLLGELRERTSDLEESLDYQTATSDVLNVISRSTSDVQPVFDTIVETATRLCSGDMAGLVTRDGELYRVAADYAVSPEWAALTRTRTWKPGRENVVSRTLLERRVVHAPDIAAEALHDQQAVTMGKARTVLGVPLLREGEPIGAMLLARQRVEPFAERQIELVRTFADQAVIAIENARLITETREALEQQT